MALLPILRYPDPRLHTHAQAVESVTDDIRQLVADMAETIAETRRTAREEHGWIMDTYLIRRPAAEAEDGAA